MWLAGKESMELTSSVSNSARSRERRPTVSIIL